MGHIVQLFNVADGSYLGPEYSLQWDDLAKSAAFSQRLAVIGELSSAPFFDHVRTGHIRIGSLPGHASSGEKKFDRHARDQGKLLHQRVGHRCARFVFAITFGRYAEQGRHLSGRHPPELAKCLHPGDIKSVEFLWRDRIGHGQIVPRPRLITKRQLTVDMLDNMSNLLPMTNAASSERANGSLKDGPQTRCAACGRSVCDHPDPIYGGIVPASLRPAPAAETRTG